MALRIPRNRIYFTKKALLKAIGLFFTPAIYNGKYVHEFENEFSNFIGIKHSIAVASGKLALYLSLKSLGAETGDKIILSDFNVPEVPALLQAMGLLPVLVDIDPENFNINIDLIEKHIDTRTKFLLVTHIFGMPVAMDKIISISRKYNLKIIEDACQSLGAEYRGRKIGSIGDIGYFSFGTLKPLSTLNGGMIVTNSDSLAKHIRYEIGEYKKIQVIKLIRQLMETIWIMILTNRIVFNYLTFPILSVMNAFNEELKFNILQGKEISFFSKEELYRLQIKFSNLQAIIGLENIRILPDMIKAISQKAEILNQLLKNSCIASQEYNKDALSAYFKYTIRVKNREKVLRQLFKTGIDVTYGYMKSCSSVWNLYKFSTNCPESLRLTEETIYLPIHSLASREEANYLTKVLTQSIGNEVK